MVKYAFKEWNDGVLSNVRELYLDRDITLTAVYKEVSGVGKVTFGGVVSAQEKENETVTITVTKPDGTTATIYAQTDATGAYAVEYSDLPATGYKAKARIEEDALYLAAESNEITFSIGKAPRTITLSVK
jgi:hypothetical protein